MKGTFGFFQRWLKGLNFKTFTDEKEINRTNFILKMKDLTKSEHHKLIEASRAKSEDKKDALRKKFDSIVKKLNSKINGESFGFFGLW
mmetsp:Transcript_34863/g.48530  ORF Transcript_34863/g.48530 Transcript_34863/m.48530 type:complete len:88 (-) Transcript_34863:138-401(-)